MAAECLKLYLSILDRRVRGSYKRECNLPREAARLIAALHRMTGKSAIIRKMRTREGLWNVYLYTRAF